MRKKSKKNPALIELILVILFFSLSSVVLIQVFAKAKRISDLSHAETLGTVYAQSLIEKWKADPKKAQEDYLLEGWQVSKEGELLRWTAELDEEMNLISDDSTPSKYHVEIEMTQEKYSSGNFYEIKVEMIRSFDQELIISFSNGQYVSAREEMP